VALLFYFFKNSKIKPKVAAIWPIQKMNIHLNISVSTRRNVLFIFISSFAKSSFVANDSYFEFILKLKQYLLQLEMKLKVFYGIKEASTLQQECFFYRLKIQLN